MKWIVLAAFFLLFTATATNAQSVASAKNGDRIYTVSPTRDTFEYRTIGGVGSWVCLNDESKKLFITQTTPEEGSEVAPKTLPGYWKRIPVSSYMVVVDGTVMDVVNYHFTPRYYHEFRIKRGQR